jgi:hypothetical protein
MESLESILAVSGFWLFLILFVFRGAIKERLSRVPTRNDAELAEMKKRLQALEGRIAIMNNEILELREVQDFDRRLAADSEKASTISTRSLTTSGAASGKRGLPLK